MIVAKDRERRIANAVERRPARHGRRSTRRRSTRSAASSSRHAPCRRRRIGQLHARGGILAVGDRADRRGETGEAVVGIARQQPVGELERIRHIAVRQSRREGAFDQFRVARIGAQRLAKIGRRRRRIAIGAGDQRGEIISGLALADFDRRRCGDAVARQSRAGGQREPQRRRRSGCGRPIGRRIREDESGESRASTFFPRLRRRSATAAA